jgi:general nucleoside transport system permease protein
MSAEVVNTPAEAVPAVHIVDVPVSRRRRTVTGSVLIVVGVACALALGLGSKAGVKAAFQFSATGAYFTIPVVSVPARLVALAIGVVIAALGVLQIARGFSRPAMRWVLAFTLVGFVVAFLCWASTGQSATIDVLGLLQQTIFLAVPLILGALGGILCERSGVVNVAIEGQMLAGAFAGSLVATLFENNAIGIVGAMIAGGLMGWLLAVFSIKYLVNQVILGVVLNVFAAGLTGFLYDALMAPDANTYNNPSPLAAVQIPVLGRIPFVGPLFFDQNWIVYITYVLIVAVQLALFRTRWGLRTRAVGEHPEAAETVGIRVRRTRYVNVVVAGLVAGLAGAFLTLGTVGAFSKGISSGKGFIALAAVIFGRWSPRGALGAALLFGFADALQTVLSFIGTPVAIPSAFLAMLPYLATIFAVAGLVGRVRAPGADGVPYEGR